MLYHTLPPPPSLKELVRFFWVFEASVDADMQYMHRSMADSCTELLFHYRGTFHELTEEGTVPSFCSGIHAQTQVYRRFVTQETFGIFGVYLYPFATLQLFNLSPDELTNKMPDLYSLFGKTGSELEERMMLAPDNNRRLQILTAFLENRLKRTSPNHHPVISVIRHMATSNGNYTVRELARQTNLSERQFERKFKEYSGFTPSRYSRIVRFEAACSRYGEEAHKTLTEIAHECGYYDQSHFIRDFREFSGYHPGIYFSGYGEGTEWRDTPVGSGQ